MAAALHPKNLVPLAHLEHGAAFADTLLLFGAGSLALIYGALGGCYAAGVKGLPLMLLVLAAIGCYAMSLAPVTWVVISEIFPNRIRGAAMSIAVAALWGSGTVQTSGASATLNVGSVGTASV